MGQEGYDAERHRTQSSWESRHPKILIYSAAHPPTPPPKYSRHKKSKCDRKSLSRQETQDYRALLAFLMHFYLLRQQWYEPGDGSRIQILETGELQNPPPGTSLEVQWPSLHAPKIGILGSTRGQGT